MGKTDTQPPAPEIKVEDKGNGVRIVKLELAHFNDGESDKTRQALLDAVPETNLKFSNAGQPPHFIVDVSALKDMGNTDSRITRLGSTLVDVSSKIRHQYLHRGQLTVAGANENIQKMISATGLGLLMNVSSTVETAMNPPSVAANRAG